MGPAAVLKVLFAAEYEKEIQVLLLITSAYVELCLELAARFPLMCFFSLSINRLNIGEI